MATALSSIRDRSSGEVCDHAGKAAVAEDTAASMSLEEELCISQIGRAVAGSMDLKEPADEAEV